MKFTLLFCFLFLANCELAFADSRPNIIFMMSDDQAWNGLSVAMHPDHGWSKSDVVDTPNLEKFAAQGIRFSAAYAPAPVCSPTRISLQTGKSCAAVHWTRAGPPRFGGKMNEPRNVREISDQEITIAELLKEAGYATAHYGKWHIEGGGPEKHGYDESDGNIGNEAAYEYEDPNPVDIFGMATRAADFMKKNQAKGKPFYLQLSWNALHAPDNALEVTKQKYANKMQLAIENRQVGLAALAEDLDRGVGKILEAVDRLGIASNTYIIYMADNGAGGSIRARRSRSGNSLAGGKGSLWEGGIRSPFIVRGPGIPANSWCHERIVGYDLFPTYCDWAQIDPAKLPPLIEGGSIVSLLNGEEGIVARKRNELVFHFPHYQQDDGPHSCLYLDNYKLLKFYEDNRLALYDIDQDIQEENDLAQRMPEKAAELDAILVQYLVDVDAQMATKNLDYDPSRQPRMQRGPHGRGPGMRQRPR